MRFVAALGCFVAAVICCATSAHADTSDDRLVNAASAAGVSWPRDQIVSEGHLACDSYGSPALTGQLARLMGQGLSNTQGTSLQLAGIRAYCPEKIAGLGF